MTAEERLAEAQRRWHRFCQFLVKEDVRSSASIMDGCDIDENLVSFSCEEEVERRVVESFVHKATGKLWFFSSPMVIVCSKWAKGSYGQEDHPTFHFTCRFEDKHAGDGHVSGYGMTPTEAYEHFLQGAASAHLYFTSPQRSKGVEPATVNAFRALFKE
jgi:hypothetical protein